MARSVFKVPFYSRKVFQLTSNFIYKGYSYPAVCRLWNRSSFIPWARVGSSVRIHAGIWLSEAPFVITPDRVGHCMGEFSFTKKRGNFIHRFNKVERKRIKKQKQLIRQKQRRKYRKKLKFIVRSKKKK